MCRALVERIGCPCQPHLHGPSSVPCYVGLQIQVRFCILLAPHLRGRSLDQMSYPPQILLCRFRVLAADLLHVRAPLRVLHLRHCHAHNRTCAVSGCWPKLAQQHRLTWTLGAASWGHCAHRHCTHYHGDLGWVCGGPVERDVSEDLLVRHFLLPLVPRHLQPQVRDVVDLHNIQYLMI